MTKRKKFIIDRKFQLKQTFSVIRITFLIVAIVVGIMAYNVARNNHRLSNITKNNDEMIGNLDNIMVIQENIVETIMTWAQKPGEKPQKRAIKVVAQKHYNNIESIKGNIKKIQSNIASNNRIIKYNNILLILLVAVLIFQIAFLYFIMIRKTHRISGPIYVISNYIREIIDGRFPSMRPIRKGDELQDFYHLFTQMVESLRERWGK
jgi:nitrate/nitrite-specific signal transduction histidine kinase